MKVQSGDDEALDRLLDRFGPRLRRWASGRLPSSAKTMLETGDVVQEALIVALRQLGTVNIQSEGALGAYLREAINKRVIDVYRSGPSALESAIGAEAVQRYDTALGRLRDNDRQAVVLRLELGYTYTELAGALIMPTADAARATVALALVRLAQEMLRGR